MPVFELDERMLFPPVELAEGNGIIAVGGDLSVERLIAAYGSGIFPWFSEGDPIIWWSPDPRFVLFTNELRVSRSMRQTLRRGIFELTIDRCFESVIRSCGEPRPNQDGTWITDEMVNAYIELHRQGFAHSVEAWKDGELAGGLYGVSLGRCFFGESMFTRENNASKAAFIHLVNVLLAKGFHLIDCQVYTSHLESLGARMVPRKQFMDLLSKELRYDTISGDWGSLMAVTAL